MLYLGIDIGITGAVAVLDEQGRFVEVFDLPVCEQQGKRTRKIHRTKLLVKVWELLQKNSITVFCEDVHAMPNGSIASFSLGHSLATVESVFESYGSGPHMVSPQKWKKHHGLLSKGKKTSIDVALELFPDAPLFRKKDHNRAEALLIAAYGWQKEVA